MKKSWEGTKLTIGWNFPPNNYGQTDGLHNPGQEYFVGMPSLAREILQNSLDAHASGAPPVEVEFSVVSVPTTDIPGHHELVAAMTACRTVRGNDPRTKDFFERAVQLFKGPSVALLKIADFNTTGLLGSDDPEGPTDWNHLVKAVGSSGKAGDAGGSFGIGKHAPFVCSPVRTVFYDTLDIKGRRAFQGVANLITHTGQDGHPTQGTGFYGVKDQNRPITDRSLVPETFRRDRPGTDIWVVGFEPDPDWKHSLVESVLDNFLLAVYYGELVVRVGGQLVDSATLPTLAETLAPEGRTKAYFDVLSADSTKVFNEKPPDKVGIPGSLSLRLLVGPNLPQTVLMARSTGMKIFDKGDFRAAGFAGIFTALGTELNQALKSMEPPEHNRWEPMRSNDVAKAKKLRTAIFKWIASKVSDAVSSDAVKVDAEGLFEYLPDEDDLEPQTAPLRSGPVELFRQNPPRMRQAGSGGQHEPRGHRKRGSSPEGRGQPGSGKPGGPSRSIDRARVWCTNPAQGNYRLRVTENTAVTGYLCLSVLAEDGTVEPMPVTRAVDAATGLTIPTTRRGRVGPLSLAAEVPATVDLVISTTGKYLLDLRLETSDED
ncbi:MAG: hypothetical protein ACYCO4_01785 [Sulfobacillus sp.]